MGKRASNSIEQGPKFMCYAYRCGILVPHIVYRIENVRTNNAALCRSWRLPAYIISYDQTQFQKNGLQLAQQLCVRANHTAKQNNWKATKPKLKKADEDEAIDGLLSWPTRKWLLGSLSEWKNERRTYIKCILNFDTIDYALADPSIIRLHFCDAYRSDHNT